ncbi:glycoprotein 3-alpha-L-fucosyltransferase A-like [Argiope bruennichi]|uniref:glycoprotein 3-alpha-L-fucosyltransferase A-like n=1 Tax=Argiope bruennichi TaxID=94029 RepID=UPI0024945E39|nr:glycoprotein 3-alpha-L-fucosyltransferase A-like [Argiope bruennichi]XP_055947250.1 glycoprotein 3-alpha-L-fucosyltransferase A-like [Argiope bruennichi]XP_055947252.1 glycoprotein 3-alpha-L-fucosyltransferase A-like [Argiope bruennichi]
MPRLRIRRMLLTLVIVICSTVLVLNLTSNSQQALLFPTKSNDREFFPIMFETPQRRKPKFENSPTLLVQQSSEQQVLVKSTQGREVKKFLFKSDDQSNHHQMERKNNLMVGPLQQPAENENGIVKLWFMKGGGVRPQPGMANTKPNLWPEQSSGDRIVEQLMYIPPNYTSSWNFSSGSSTMNSISKPKLKKILLYFGKGGWNDLPMGRTVFLRDKCPVNTCELTTSLKDAEQADALFFKDRFLWPFYKRQPHQVWILFLLECPLHTQAFKNLKHVFNWTATYRHDSDLVAPYEKFVSYNTSFDYIPGQKSHAPAEMTNYASNKTKKVAWFVSNCNAKNKRLEYAKELGQHIEVDIYGSCGNKKCPRTLTHKCFRMLDKEYKFYLAFENSNCKDYITEKFFVNGLSRNIVPIVMGARPEDYARAAPPHSYIHVDDFASPKELAEYLSILDKNDTLYNEYFRWKGTGEFINTYFWCRMCAMLHAPPYHKSYPDMHKWWSGAGTCSAGNWRNRATKPPQQLTANSVDIKDDNG